MSKRQKFTNKHQLEMMVDAMKSNDDIARGTPKCAHSDLSDFWKELTYKLNTLGPPVKDMSGWKKVWVDFKWGVKKKLIRNKNYLLGAGDGRQGIALSRLEKEVNKIFKFDKALPGKSCPALKSGTAEIIENEPNDGEDHAETAVENYTIYELPLDESCKNPPPPKNQRSDSKIVFSTCKCSATDEKQRLENELLKINIYKAKLEARQLELLMGLPSIFVSKDDKKDTNEIGQNHLKFLNELKNSKSSSSSPQRKSADYNRHTNEIFENNNRAQSENDAVKYLFQSYGQTFKKLSLQKQSYLKIELAKLFAKAEESESYENVQLLNATFEPTETSNGFDITEVIEQIKVEESF